MVSCSYLLECSTFEPYSPHHGPACSSFGNDPTDKYVRNPKSSIKMHSQCCWLFPLCFHLFADVLFCHQPPCVHLQDEDGDGYVSVSFHEDRVDVGSYNWGNTLTTANGEILLLRGSSSTSDEDERGIFQVCQSSTTNNAVIIDPSNPKLRL